LTAFTSEAETPCAVVNTHFGRFPGADNITHLLALVSQRCRSSESPLRTGIGRECMRLMQTAFCSSSCPAYGSAKGRPCFNWDAMFRACGKWASATTRISLDTASVDNGCPLDPNNIPKASSLEAKCDNETPITYTGLWEATFGLYDPLPAEESDS
jgi:hypothetical protein